MQDFGLTFHHMGLALKKEDEALKFLAGMGYTAGEKRYDDKQKVFLRMCSAVGRPNVELVTEGPEKGPITAILKRYSELVYHTCYETNDLQKSLKAMDAAGLRVIETSPPTPAILFDGRLVSFYTVIGFGVIEILEA